MRQITGRNCGDELWMVGSGKDFDLVEPANGDVCELSVDVARKLTWFVMGPVSSTATVAKGGSALNTWVFPMSLSVNHTCLPSGVAAMSGQKGEACFTRPTIWWFLVSITTVSGVKLEQT